MLLHINASVIYLYESTSQPAIYSTGKKTGKFQNEAMEKREKLTVGAATTRNINQIAFIMLNFLQLLSTINARLIWMYFEKQKRAKMKA